MYAIIIIIIILLYTCDAGVRTAGTSYTCSAAASEAVFSHNR